MINPHNSPEASGSKATEQNLHIHGVMAKIVTATMAGPDGSRVRTKTADLLDGKQVRVITAVDTSDLPSGTIVSHVAGLPYLTADPNPSTCSTCLGTPPDVQQEKVLEVQGITSGTTLSFGQDGATLDDRSGVTAGPMAIPSPNGVSVTNPPGRRQTTSATSRLSGIRWKSTASA